MSLFFGLSSACPPIPAHVSGVLAKSLFLRDVPTSLFQSSPSFSYSTFPCPVSSAAPSPQAFFLNSRPFLRCSRLQACGQTFSRTSLWGHCCYLRVIFSDPQELCLPRVSPFVSCALCPLVIFCISSNSGGSLLVFSQLCLILTGLGGALLKT